MVVIAIFFISLDVVAGGHLLGLFTIAELNRIHITRSGGLPAA